MTIAVTKNNAYANSVISNITRVANETDNNGRKVAVYDVTFTSVDAMTSTANGASKKKPRVSIKQKKAR